MSARHFLARTFVTLLIGFGLPGLAGTAAAQSTASATFAYGMLDTLPSCATTDVAGCGGTAGKTSAGVVYAQPNSGAELAAGPGSREGIVFCDRIQQLNANFSGRQGTANLTTGVVTCSTPEVLHLILKTLDAAAFNFVAANLPSGVHTVEEQARSSAATSATGINGSLGVANAFIGMGSVAVESIPLAKGKDGTTLAQALD